jgi:3',5'-cyclic AMP phosphodiesterase CpdA
MTRQFELKPAAKPDWAKREDKPLARLVWFTDLHLDASSLKLADDAFAYMNTLKPDAVLVTGDNCAYAPKDFRPDLKDRYVRRWAFFKQLVDSKLKAPAVVIPGDNWPWGYDKVYGSRQFRVDVAGVQIICLGTDRAARGIEGCATFDDTTWTWLEQELAKGPTKPTLIAMHENTAPPTFLDAGRLERVLQKHPQVLGTLTGHLHVDVELTANGLHHIVCPALGPSFRHGLKEITVYPDAILLQTHELGDKGEFHPVEIWQKIEIPPILRTGLAPLPSPYRLVKQSEVPASPKVEDPSLRHRSPELLAPAMSFLMQRGMQTLVSPWRKKQP